MTTDLSAHSDEEYSEIIATLREKSLHSDVIGALGAVSNLDPVIAGTLLYAVGIGLDNWRIDHVGMGILLTSISDGDLLATIGDTSGVAMIISGVTGNPIKSTVQEWIDQGKEGLKEEFIDDPLHAIKNWKNFEGFS